MEVVGFVISGVYYFICFVMLGDVRLVFCMVDDMLKRGEGFRRRGLVVGFGRKEGNF